MVSCGRALSPTAVTVRNTTRVPHAQAGQSLLCPDGNPFFTFLNLVP